MSTPFDQIIPVLWARRDVPGTESCRILGRGSGWELDGTAVFAADGLACRLDYHIACDRDWVTKSATVSGWIGARDIDIRIMRAASGRWDLNGAAVPAVAGCFDLDLNFSPSTNLLPIRRLRLAVGETATVSAAWLRFPNFKLERLEQTYIRIADRRYRYESGNGKFVAEVTVDDLGLVLDYGEIWSREVAS